MKLKTTSKQFNGKILNFRAKLDDEGLIHIKVYIGNWLSSSYYLGTLATFNGGRNREWCIQRGQYVDYLAVNEHDAEALIKEAQTAFPDDAANYKARFPLTS